MSKVAVVTAKIQAFSDSASALGARMASTLSGIRTLQFARDVVTGRTGPLTPASYEPTAGSVDRQLLDAVAVRGGVADALDQYGRMLSCLVEGSAPDALNRQRTALTEATAQLAALAQGDADLSRADSDLAADTARSQPKPMPHKEAELVNAGNKLLGAVGFVAKVANNSAPGDVSGVIVIVSQRVTTAIRVRRGMKTLAVMVPPMLADIDRMAGELAASAAPLSAAIDRLLGDVIAASNGLGPAADPAARFAYDFQVATLLRDGRGLKAALAEMSVGYARLGSLHRDAAAALAAGAPAPAEPAKAPATMVRA